MSSSDGGLHPLSDDGGINSPPSDMRDPFEALDDLMQVIEALCPTWPDRELFPETESFKL